MVRQNGGRPDLCGDAAFHSAAGGGLSFAEAVSPVAAGWSGALYAVCAHFVSGAGRDGGVLYVYLYSGLFHDIAPGAADDVYFYGGFSFRCDHSAAVYAGRRQDLSGAAPLRGHVQSAASDLQR